jgi:hypothetical protein
LQRRRCNFFDHKLSIFSGISSFSATSQQKPQIFFQARRWGYREQFTLGESRFRPRNQLVKSQTFRQLRIPTKLDSLSSGSFMVNPYFCWLNPYFCWLNPVLLVNFSIFDAFKI